MNTVERIPTASSEKRNMGKKKLFYYRIFDDKEKLNYLKLNFG
jgi:hypothetical protein